MKRFSLKNIIQQWKFWMNLLSFESIKYQDENSQRYQQSIIGFNSILQWIWINAISWFISTMNSCSFHYIWLQTCFFYFTEGIGSHVLLTIFCFGVYDHSKGRQVTFFTVYSEFIDSWNVCGHIVRELYQ